LRKLMALGPFDRPVGQREFDGLAWRSFATKCPHHYDYVQWQRAFPRTRRRSVGVSFGASWDLRLVRVDANPCYYKFEAKFRSKRQLACECESVQNHAEAVCTHYESAAYAFTFLARTKQTDDTLERKS
jgi:hypothetical protein